MKFDLSYIDKDGSKKTPVVLHRAVFGSIDRFIAYYLEETRGVLPLWLAPLQVNIIPVNNEYHLDYSDEINKLLQDANVRVKVDDRNEKLSYKMRESQTKKIPLTLILGDNEKNNGLISFRKFGSQETTTMGVDEFLAKIKECIETKGQNL